MVPKHLGYFSKKECRQNMSKVAQSSHTAVRRLTEVKSFGLDGLSKN